MLIRLFYCQKYRPRNALMISKMKKVIRNDISTGKPPSGVFDKSFRTGIMIGSVIEIKKL